MAQQVFIVQMTTEKKDPAQLKVPNYLRIISVRSSTKKPVDSRREKPPRSGD